MTFFADEEKLTIENEAAGKEYEVMLLNQRNHAIEPGAFRFLYYLNFLPAGIAADGSASRPYRKGRACALRGTHSLMVRLNRKSAQYKRGPLTRCGFALPTGLSGSR